MALFMWLDEIKTQFHYVGSEGAFGELEEDQSKDSYVRCSQANNIYFLSIPQVLRRCFFLSPNEKIVFWELMAWMDDYSFCKVSLKTLSMYTGLSDKTVSKMLNGLLEKGFIKRKRTTDTDMFMMRNLSKNPYILVSEITHNWIKSFMRQTLPKENKARKLENLFFYDIPLSFDIARRTAKEFVTNPRLYKPYIRQLEQEGDFLKLYVKTRDGIEQFLSESQNAKAETCSKS